jgi:hypothetical protein
MVGSSLVQVAIVEQQPASAQELLSRGTSATAATLAAVKNQRIGIAKQMVSVLPRVKLLRIDRCLSDSTQGRGFLHRSGG